MVLVSTRSFRGKEKIVKRMKLAIIGIRGIPVTYSAFETFAQALAIDLVNKQHTVTVYCRRKYISKNKKKYMGVRLVSLKNIEKKNLGTLTHSFLSSIHACFFEKPDIILFLGVGSCIFSFFPRILGIKTLVHIDGLDWKRKKWGFLGQKFLLISEYMTRFLPNAVITDSKYMASYYKRMYHHPIHNIPFGYFRMNEKKEPTTLLKKYGLDKKKYFVWVGRIVPENYLEELLNSFTQIDTEIKCVVIGDDLYESAYKKRIYKLINQNKNIVKTGFIKHEDTLMLVANSLAYIETKRSGGTHVSLVEAMGTGTIIVSNSHKANHGILENTALYYSNKNPEKNLAKLLVSIALFPNKYSSFGLNVKKRAEEYYEWESVFTKYRSVFTTILNP